jgi:hypothetical protein
MRASSTVGLVMVCAWGALTGACSSKSSGPGGNGAEFDAGGTSFDSGSGSGGSSGGGSGGGSGGSSGGSSGSSSGSGSGGGTDPTQLAGGLTDPQSLIVAGSKLFWVEGQGTATSVIKSIPAAGGSVTTVVTTANLAGDLASDGTSLYFGILNSTTNKGEIDSAGLDGSGQKPLTTTIAGWSGPTSQNGASDLFVVNGTLYFPGDPTGAGVLVVESMPTSGGTPTGLFSASSTSADTVLETLFGADSSGVTIAFGQVSLSTGMGSSNFGVVPLAGGAPSMLLSVPTAMATTTPFVNTGGGVVDVGGQLTYLSSVSSTNEVFVEKVAAAGGTPSQIADLKPWSAGWLVADANGIYVDQSIASDAPGIYTVSSTGSTTLFEAAQVASVTTGHARELVLDATHLYWIAGGFNGGQATVHAKAR